MVAHFFAFVEQVAMHYFGGLIDRVVDRFVDSNLISALGRVTFGLLVADASVVHDHEVEMNLGGVLPDRFEMLARAVAVSLTGLRHQVADEDLRR